MKQLLQSLMLLYVKLITLDCIINNIRQISYKKYVFIAENINVTYINNNKNIFSISRFISLNWEIENETLKVYI